MSDPSISGGLVPRFLADPEKTDLLVRRGDIAEFIGTIGLALSSHLEATAHLLGDHPEVAQERLQATTGHLRRLVDECRAFVGRAEDPIHGG